MNHLILHPKRPIQNITWQATPSPTQGEHRYEVRDHEISNALKRCVQSGRLEAK